jgi:subtilase family serine protease
VPAVGQAGCAALITPGSTAMTAGALAASGTAPSGYGPLDLRAAYGLDSSAITGGVGQTVAVVTAYDDASAESDMGTYREQYKLPACTTANGCFKKVDATGGTSYPPAMPGWSASTAQSLDMISAICPNCHILLVEAGNPAIPVTTGADALGQAENEAAALGAKFVDNTIYTSESTYSTQEPTLDRQYFDHPGVVITAPDGNGGYPGPWYPAASPDVVAVGGTTLTAAPTSARGWAEAAWPSTGSGCSGYESAKPSWQTDTGCTDRMLNDLSAAADQQKTRSRSSTPPAAAG